MINYEQKLGRQPFIPVILGANIGVYSTARSFHEAYGSTSINICRESVGSVRHSVMIRTMVEPHMEDETKLLACLDRIMEIYPEIPKILIGSADWHVKMIVRLKDKLVDKWIIPYTNYDILTNLTNKRTFYETCETLGVDYPKYVSMNGKDAKDADMPFAFPVVIKPANSSTYQVLSFPGKKKVFIAKDRPEFDHIMSLIINADYMDDLIIQEFVPGDDTSMHILTLYTAQDGQTKLASFGQTLLEDHTPGGIGNPLAIRTFRNDEVVQQAKRLVEHSGYIGFSNFDLKYDKRDGKYKFFELNARLGRSNYYVTAEGHNPSHYYVKDYLEHHPLTFSVAENEVLYSVIPKRLLLKHIKQQQDLVARVKGLYKSRLVRNPLKYFPVEKSIRRLFYVAASTFNYFRKFKRYPPVIMGKEVYRSNEKVFWNNWRFRAKGNR
ncbi:MAG TPA: carbamoyl phosphate synthase-like protein [Bacillales bacterium]|nr:carbamoyl phosphate synthase-like protein [Bacillales bacterium]